MAYKARVKGGVVFVREVPDGEGQCHTIRDAILEFWNLQRDEFDANILSIQNRKTKTLEAVEKALKCLEDYSPTNEGSENR